jgi:hypothetical protein
MTGLDIVQFYNSKRECIEIKMEMGECWGPQPNNPGSIYSYGIYFHFLIIIPTLAHTLPQDVVITCHTEDLSVDGVGLFLSKKIGLRDKISKICSHRPQRH